jgi:hypothetical protein
MEWTFKVFGTKVILFQNALKNINTIEELIFFNWHSSKKWFHGDQIEFKDFDFSMTFSWSLENTNELENIFHCFLFSFWESVEEFWEKGFDLFEKISCHFDL